MRNGVTREVVVTGFPRCTGVEGATQGRGFMTRSTEACLSFALRVHPKDIEKIETFGLFKGRWA